MIVFDAAEGPLPRNCRGTEWLSSCDSRDSAPRHPSLLALYRWLDARARIYISFTPGRETARRVAATYSASLQESHVFLPCFVMLTVFALYARCVRRCTRFSRMNMRLS